MRILDGEEEENFSVFSTPPATLKNWSGKGERKWLGRGGWKRGKTLGGAIPRMNGWLGATHGTRQKINKTSAELG